MQDVLNKEVYIAKTVASLYTGIWRKILVKANFKLGLVIYLI